MNRLILILSIALSAPGMAQAWQIPGDLTQIPKRLDTTEKVPEFNDNNTPSTHPSTSKPDPENRNSTDKPSYPARPTPIDMPGGDKLAEICFGFLRKSFYDPYSAKMDSFQILQMPDSGFTISVMLNGKNKFGGYVGSRPFYCRKLPSGKWDAGEGIPDSY